MRGLIAMYVCYHVRVVMCAIVADDEVTCVVFVAVTCAMLLIIGGLVLSWLWFERCVVDCACCLFGCDVCVPCEFYVVVVAGIVVVVYDVIVLVILVNVGVGVDVVVGTGGFLFRIIIVRLLLYILIMLVCCCCVVC